MANASMGYVFAICSIILRRSAHHILTARSLGDTPLQKMGMRQSGKGFPPIFDFDRLEPEARPSLFEAFANLRQAFVDPERRDE